ncbi:MAG: carboxypeptidase regulatory-like domain-containing protein [Acidobacteria bacterium]|nr:carboxypeptidase regulatory-like domain-containing protein [Acidobacteriota bacterium]
MLRDSRRRFLLAGSLLFCIWVSQSAYVVFTLQDLTRISWRPDDFPITIHIWEGFTDQSSSVVRGSNPKLALREALQSWATTSSLTITLGPDTPVQEVGGDNFNVVTIADSQNNRNFVGAAAAQSLFRWVGSTLKETDVVFNPGLKFSTVETTDSDILNIFHTALHEFGHSWNLKHSIPRTSTMFFQATNFGFGFNELCWDDIAGINVSYPLVGMRQITGTISGKVVQGGSPVFGAFVVATDEQGILTASAVTMPDGTYKLEFLPSGRYTLYVEPLDGLMTPVNLVGGVFDSSLTTDFLPKFYSDTMAPSVQVTSDVIGIDFAVTQGNAVVDEPEFIGTTTNPAGAFGVSSGAAEVFQGMNTNFIVAGKGVDSLRNDQGVLFLGTNLTAGSVARSGSFPNGPPFKIVPLTVPADTPKGDYSAILQTNDRQSGVLTGALSVFSPLRFLQAFAQFAHAPNTASSSLFLINTDLNRTTKGKISAMGDGGARTAISLGSLGQDSNNRLDVALNPGGTLSVKTGGNASFVGSVRVEADRGAGGTVLFETISGTTGVGASQPLYSFVAPIEVKGGDANTGLAITILDDRPAKVYLQVQDKDGVRLDATIIDIAGNGHVAKFIGELLSTVPADFQGTVVVTANRKMGATVIRTAPGVFTTFPVIQNRVIPRSFYAQFANATNLTSDLQVVNPSPLRAATVQIQVRDRDGSPVAVTLNGELLGDGRKTVVVPPLGLVSLKTGGSGALVGSVEVFSEIPVGGVVLFSSPSIGTAGVGESFPLTRMVLPLSRSTAADTDTGVALVNTEDRQVNLKVTVRSQAGSIVRGPKEIALKARAQLARFPNESPLDLNLDATFTGSIWIEADGQIAATVLRLSPGVLTTFPAISLEPFVTPAN